MRLVLTGLLGFDCCNVYMLPHMIISLIVLCLHLDTNAILAIVLYVTRYWVQIINDDQNDQKWTCGSIIDLDRCREWDAL